MTLKGLLYYLESITEWMSFQDFYKSEYKEPMCVAMLWIKDWGQSFGTW